MRSCHSSPGTPGWTAESTITSSRAHPPGLAEKLFALGRLEMAVEMTGEDPLERAVLERELERVAANVRRVGRLAAAPRRASNRSGRGRRSPRAGAGSGTRCRRRRRAFVPPGAPRVRAAGRRSPRPSLDAPGRRSGRCRDTTRRTPERGCRSTPSPAPRLRTWRGRSSRCRTSRRGVTGRRSMRSPRRSARGRACSTCTPTKTTTARSSRSSAPRTSSSTALLARDRVRA